MDSVLIITAPIVSHILPTFNLARRLTDLGFLVHYLVESRQDAELIETNEFQATVLKSRRVAIGGDLSYYIQKHGRSRLSWFEVIKCHLNFEMFNDRRRELSDIISAINPVAALIDVFSSTDFMVLHSLNAGLRKVFISPMLDTSRLEHAIEEKPKSLLARFCAWSKSSTSFEGFIWRLTLIERYMIFLKSGLSFNNRFNRANKRILAFMNVPELILAPCELEYQLHSGETNKHYLGLTIDAKRKFMDSGKSKNALALIDRKKESGHNIVYCSFGTYYNTDDYARITAFLIALTSAVQESKFFILVSVKSELLEMASDYLTETENIHFESDLPQTKFLVSSDLFITHGGLSSIKEAIHFEVPMLVCPLDLSWDQYPNGKKVAFHAIGLSGSLDGDEIDDLYRKLEELMYNKSYKNNTVQMKRSIETRYDDEFFKELFSRVIL